MKTEVCHKVNNFGSYRIIGDIELVGTCYLSKVDLTLYFNHFNKKFFMVKQYASSKYHIDFFMHKIFDLFSLNEINNLEEIARIDEKDIENGLLFFNGLDNKFIFVNSNGYSMELRKV